MRLFDGAITRVGRVAVLGLVIAALLLLLLERPPTSEVPPPIALAETPLPAPGTYESMIHDQLQETGMLTAPFEPSLEMQENVDFLLAPALLLQSMTWPQPAEHVTYPED